MPTSQPHTYALFEEQKIAGVVIEKLRMVEETDSKHLMHKSGAWLRVKGMTGAGERTS